MPTVHERLTALLHSEQARTLAQFAPLGLLAVVSGSIMGVAVGAPAVATAGLGLVLTSLATNLVSSMLYDAVRPDADDDARGAAIQRGLAADDPQVQALVADLLLALGPQLAQALPPAYRPALTQGMQQAGGRLAAIAPAISAALADPQADWAALQQRLAPRITGVEQVARARDNARLIDNRQEAVHSTGPISQVLDGSGASLIQGTTQIVTGAGHLQAQTGGRGDVPGGDLQHQREVLAATIARLKVRELQRAQYGIEAPPHVVTELDDLRAEVARLRAALGV